MKPPLTNHLKSIILSQLPMYEPGNPVMMLFISCLVTQPQLILLHTPHACNPTYKCIYKQLKYEYLYSSYMHVWAIYEQELIKWLMNSPADPHSLYGGDTSRWKILLFSMFVVNACSCAAKINPSVSFVNPTYLIHCHCQFGSTKGKTSQQKWLCKVFSIHACSLQ